MTVEMAPLQDAFVGRGGSGTGKPADIFIVDDPIKDRLQAESATYRARTWDWFKDVFFTRIEPQGSVIVNMARWHPDDLAGRCINEFGWEYVCLKAVNDDGSVLWPQRWPRERLDEIKEVLGDFSWASLYQGDPRTRGESVFGDAHTYSAPLVAYVSAFGLDLAYTAKKTNDYSVAIEMRRQGDKIYVANMTRRQVTAPEFKATCVELHRAQPNAPWRWYAAGTERGAADFFTQGDDGIPLSAMTPNGDKFTRAMGYAAAWNAGRVLVPESAPWVAEFLSEHAGFTGVGDRHDDIIDAAVAAFDQLENRNSGQVRSDVREPTKRGGLAAVGM